MRSSPDLTIKGSWSRPRPRFRLVWFGTFKNGSTSKFLFGCFQSSFTVQNFDKGKERRGKDAYWADCRSLCLNPLYSASILFSDYKTMVTHKFLCLEWCQEAPGGLGPCRVINLLSFSCMSHVLLLYVAAWDAMRVCGSRYTFGIQWVIINYE